MFGGCGDAWSVGVFGEEYDELLWVDVDVLGGGVAIECYVHVLVEFLLYIGAIGCWFEAECFGS